MKKYLSIICAAAMICSLAGCSSSDSDSDSKAKSSKISASEAEDKTKKETKKEESTPEPETAEPTTEEVTEAPTEEQTKASSDNLSIASHYLTKNRSGDDILVIEYAWTNDEDEEEAFYINVRDSVFQNGVECSDLVIIDDINAQDQMNKIMPGTTVNIKIAYKLQDMTNARVVCTDLFGDKTLLDETIDLGGGEGAAAPTEVGETSLEYVSHRMTKDYKDQDVLLVEYDFHNGENSPESFTMFITDSAYQNGVECDNSVFGVDEIDSAMHLADIQPGVTTRIVVGYHIKDKSPVTLKATSLFGDKEYLNKTIEIG
ncbi:MAG: DUF5067 domain-containing protein [Erysipelotrichaceae bacterium]|nr:DUF5067 domain-containing protein [Erysipelotrichaceae bacterium]